MEICRLCCSSNFVNNEIFDEESALYIKMSLYLPIKVSKNDRLPQKICDKCSCKVNDFYQFCNEAIEVQQKLQTSLKILNIPIPNLTYDAETKSNHIHSTLNNIIKNNCTKNSRSTQTDVQDYTIQVKQESIPSPPAALSPKLEEESGQDYEENINDSSYNNCEVPSDDSDDIYLHRLKSKKEKVSDKKNKKLKEADHNGDIKENRKEKKRKNKLEQQLQDIVNCAVLPEGTTISLKQEDEEINLDIVKAEPVDEDDLNFFGLDSPQWKCCICFDSKCLKSELLNHYKKHALGYDSRNSRANSPVMTDGVIKCPTCDKMFRDKISWLRHDNSIHGKRPYQCSLCEKTFKEPSHILRHGMTHTYTEDLLPASKRYVCDLCPQEFVYRKSLIEHRSSHPEAQERKLLYNCLECGRGFAHSNSLRRHRRSHTGERNFLCNVCGKAMSNREHLKFHIRIHTGYKPNICKTCGKGFAKKCNLTLHERTHTGEKPHICSHCGKAFSQRSTLVIHERYHSGARPYVCTLCGRGFVAKGLLSMHLKTTCI